MPNSASFPFATPPPNSGAGTVRRGFSRRHRFFPIFWLTKSRGSAFESSRAILQGKEDRVAVGPPDSHRLDIVLADELAWSNFKMSALHHRLGRCSITFCSVPVLWQLKLKSQSCCDTRRERPRILA